MLWIDRLRSLREQALIELSQEEYDPHTYKHPELGYIEIMAQKGRAHAAKVQDSDTFDKFQHILDNVKILVDRLD